jgi:hypothetical protein
MNDSDLQKRKQIATDPNIVEINVGGEIFATTIQTLGREQSVLMAMISGQIQSRRDTQGRLFIDRDPTHFRWILNYLRDGYLITLPSSAQDRAELLHEARCFRLQGLVTFIDQYNQTNHSDNDSPVQQESPSVPTFQTARPSSKGVFFVADVKWESFGLTNLKEGLDIFGVRFEDGKDEVTFCSLSGHGFGGSFAQVDYVCQSKLAVTDEPKAKGIILASTDPNEVLDAFFWWEPSNTQYPQLFGQISRGETVYLSRGLDFFRTEQEG